RGLGSLCQKYRSNHAKPFLSTRTFLHIMNDMLAAHRLHPWTTVVPSETLLNILIAECLLNVHCFTNPLGYSNLFSTWFTNYADGPLFGAKVLGEGPTLEGINPLKGPLCE